QQQQRRGGKGQQGRARVLRHGHRHHHQHTGHHRQATNDGGGMGVVLASLGEVEQVQARRQRMQALEHQPRQGRRKQGVSQSDLKQQVHTTPFVFKFSGLHARLVLSQLSKNQANFLPRL